MNRETVFWIVGVWIIGSVFLGFGIAVGHAAADAIRRRLARARVRP